jgi:uncharacterized 2Fe-2S/4Fe-4S cluster protein (DUF4445 family)
MPGKSKTVKVTIHLPDTDIQTSARSGDLLADIILAAGIIFDRPCAGQGKCGKCRVEARGELSPVTDAEKKHLSQEEQDNHIRLACQTRILGDVDVTVQAGAVHTDKIFGAEVDPDRLPGDLGLAIDLGTTTVGAFLVTLEECRVHAGYAVLNQQISYGAEIISRMAAAESGKAEELKSLARESIHEAIEGLKIKKKARRRIRRAVVVGNTAMHHLALGLPVGQLIRMPFQPYSHDVLSAEDGFLGKGFSQNIPVRFPPVIGGFVGTDALACLLYFGFENTESAKEQDEAIIAVDLGTNGEVMVTDGRKTMVTSTAAGPAFEGVNISCGMRALPGAIISADTNERGQLKLDTIENADPRGIAGSGLLSLVKLFVKTGRISKSGRIIEPGCRERNRIDLSPEVYLSQEDIRELQKAKAAVRAALDTLLERQNLRPDKIRRFILTGSFGGRVPVDDAIELGIIPPVPRDAVHSIPNGAGMGAALMLDEENFERAVALSKKAEHIELNMDREFMDRFIESMKLSKDI